MDKKNRAKINLVICDDDRIMIEKIRCACERILEDEFELHIETASSAKELLQKDSVFQIALLDVQMPETDGIDLARELLSRNENCRIIFISGFLNVVSDVYDVPHFCLILKEQMEVKLPEFLKRAASMAAEDAGRTLCVSTGRQTEEILLRDLVLLERRGHKTFCTLLDGRQIQCREKLSELLNRIGSTNFVHCHISYVVNLAYVEQEEGNGFRMKTGQWAPISRPNQKACNRAFWQYLSKQM